MMGTTGRTTGPVPRETTNQPRERIMIDNMFCILKISIYVSSGNEVNSHSKRVTLAAISCRRHTAVEMYNIWKELNPALASMSFAHVEYRNECVE